MREGYVMKNVVRVIYCVTISVVLHFTEAGAAAPMNNFCVTPPFIQQAILPNLLLLIDNSSSMYDLQFVDPSTTALFCHDATYKNSKVCSNSLTTTCTADSGCTGGTCINQYPGYFDQADVYKYDGAKFISGQTLPNSGGTYRSAYLYIAMSGTKGAADRKVTDFYATGKFLNWLTASKFDTQKNILTGGKYDTENGYLVSESRGCNGRRFVKEIPIADWITPAPSGHPATVSLTLAVRGPSATEPDDVNPTANGGNNRIEVYEKAFNTADCQAAYDAWLSGDSLGTWSTSSTNCLGLSAGNTSSGRELASFTESTRGCYQIRQNIAAIKAGATLNEANLMKLVTINNLETQCSNIYTKDCADPNNIQSCAVLNDQKRGNYLCSKDVDHLQIDKSTDLGRYYAFFDSGALSDTTGLIGNCWNGGSDKFSGNSICVNREFMHYCYGLAVAEVIDPTTVSNDSSVGNIPAILADAGIRAEGEPIPYSGNTDKFMYVRVQKSAPTGIINEFSSIIRIGAMTFNNDGSGSECGTAGSSISCAAPTETDGGKIISYIGKGTCSNDAARPCTTDANCTSGGSCSTTGVGDHSGGLVKVIDDIQAVSWTPFAESFNNAIGYFARTSSGTSRTDLRLSGTDKRDYDEQYNPSQYKCQTNNVLIITDGMSTADQNSTVKAFADKYTRGDTGFCSYYSGSKMLDDLVWTAKNKKISDTNLLSGSAGAPQELNESISTYVVYSGPTNSNTTDQCIAQNLMNKANDYGTAGLTVHRTTAFPAANPTELDQSLRSVFADIAGGAASGTAASILSNSEGSGATLMQALFYPLKEFDKINSTDTSTTSVKWIGELQGYWYFLDPYLQNTSIREDTDQNNKLNLISDKVIQFYFDPVKKKTLVNKYSDLNGDGNADSSTPDSGAAGVSPDVVNSLWKAGRKLWERNLSTDSRKIYVGLPDWATNSTANMLTFDKATTSSLSTANKTLLQYLTQTIDADTFRKSAGEDVGDPYNTKFGKLIDYVHGIDQAADADGTTYRPRKVQIDYCGLSDAQGCYREWKMGDIVSSTPKIVSNLRLNNYDLPTPTGYGDTSYAAFTKTTGYSTRGMSFVGGNDGMLHAFKLGVLKELKGKYDKAQLNDSSGTLADAADQLGREQWAFIPKGALPYLRYLNDPGYGHQYYVDKTPTVFDASIDVPAGCSSDYSACPKSADGSTWRTVLIGGMGIGGASGLSASHSDATGYFSCVPDASCVNCVTNPVCDDTGYGGMSGYFALDVTSPETPRMLWNFTPNNLGFSTTGPAIIRIAHKDVSGKPDHTKNGKWFAVFASGPTGPIDTDNRQFKGESQQELRIYIVDIVTGNLVKTINTGISNAFAGTLTTSWIDTDRSNPSSNGYYSDDAVYIGYVQRDTSVTPATWTKGGVLRLLTRESDDPASSDVNKQWTLSSLIDNVGPVTTSISKLQDRANNNLWIYFGTGRFYYKGDDASTTRRAIYGIKEPCYSTANRTMQAVVPGGTINDIDQGCTDAASGTLVDQSDNPSATLAGSAPGWKVLLDEKDDTNGFLTERIITDPIAAANGAVFFTSFKPSSDLCKYGGNSLLWALRYDTGGTPPASAMKGKALMQVSTGAFAEIKLSDAFNNPGSTRYDGRRLATPITGVPPTSQGLSLFTNPPPTKKLMHVREK